jgi:hypothetical protein
VYSNNTVNEDYCYRWPSRYVCHEYQKIDYSITICTPRKTNCFSTRDITRYSTSTGRLDNAVADGLG